MSRELIAGELPVVVLGAGDIARTRGRGAPSRLSVSLTLSASHVLSFTLADFRDILFHYVCEITSHGYAAVQAASLLRVDFSEFPRHFAELLSAVRAAENDFVAFLEMPDEEAGVPPRFCVAERKDLGYAPQLTLSMTVSSELVLRSEIAARTKIAQGEAAAAVARAIEAERRAVAAESSVRELREEKDALRGRLDSLSAAHASCDKDREAIQELADTASALVAEQHRELEELRVRAREGDEVRTRLDAALAEVETRKEAEERLAGELASVRADEAEGVRKLTLAVNEIHRGNRVIGQLKSELKTLKRNTAIASAVNEEREKVVTKYETRIAELEQTVRRTQNRLDVRELEREGLEGRLQAALRIVEEKKVLIQEDRKNIAYLNRELNKATIALQVRQGTPYAPSDYDTSSSTGDPWPPPPPTVAAGGEGGLAPRLQPGQHMAL